ncbi:MAG: filamentous hemagglutinin N-terminal domain-containing protein [Acaryochloridaceae cyanobacterium RL_2_7]|nr:filamentous hemagglutinin N-terminal domain-containing protein [Acaryochloridaceae cyanobacterium RL_2_7]
MTLILMFFIGHVGFFTSHKSLAIPVPDSSLGTQVIQVRPGTFRVEAGQTVGRYLFHSFESFSIAEGQTVRFQPSSPQSIQTIFTRVTGRTPSNLLGRLQTRGNADFVFLNPNGIFLGDNFKLQINGSFLATTAESILFDENGDRFSSDLSHDSTLLKVSVPTGLGFSDKPGAIRVATGNDTRGFNNGLVVNSEQDLALIGGALELTEAKLIAPGGDLWLHSAAAGEHIQWQMVNDHWKFSLPTVGDNIVLQQSSRLFSSFDKKKGGENGLISLAGAHIDVRNSELNAENRGKNLGGSISLNAMETLRVQTSEKASVRTVFTTQPRFLGHAGDISLKSKNIEISGDGTRLVSDTAQFRLDTNQTNNLGIPGNISLFASDRIDVANSVVISAVSRTANRPSGQIVVRARNLNMAGGAQIRNSIQGGIPGGILNVDVADEIVLSGFTQVNSGGARVFRPTGLVSDANGNNVGGEIRVTTQHLKIKEGAGIVSISPVDGISGDIFIDATTIQLLNGGQISATAENEDAGTAGNINIVAQDHLVIQGDILLPNAQDPTERRISSIRAETRTLQNNTVSLGNIKIQTPRLLLQEGGFISANSDGSRGGNISLEVSELLQLNSSGRIISDARSGSGGVIEVKGNPWIIAIPGSNSDITANSVQSSGGQILLRNRGLEGFSIIQTPQTPAQLLTLSTNQSNEIAASSGNPNLQGRVLVSNFNERTSQFDTLEVSLASPDPNTACQEITSQAKGDFRVVGQGGIPVDSPILKQWEDLRTDMLTASGGVSNVIATTNFPETGLAETLEATGWKFDEQGRAVLMQVVSSSFPNLFASVACFSFG